jgi:hypothetical protein
MQHNLLNASGKNLLRTDLLHQASTNIFEHKDLQTPAFWFIILVHSVSIECYHSVTLLLFGTFGSVGTLLFTCVVWTACSI